MCLVNLVSSAPWRRGWLVIFSLKIQFYRIGDLVRLILKCKTEEEEGTKKVWQVILVEGLRLNLWSLSSQKDIRPHICVSLYKENIIFLWQRNLRDVEEIYRASAIARLNIHNQGHPARI